MSSFSALVPNMEYFNHPLLLQIDTGDVRQTRGVHENTSEGDTCDGTGIPPSREYESDGVQRRIFELCADTVAKLDRAERREEESTPSDI
jgi:hypothetical protein